LSVGESFTSILANMLALIPWWILDVLTEFGQNVCKVKGVRFSRVELIAQE